MKPPAPAQDAIPARRVPIFTALAHDEFEGEPVSAPPRAAVAPRKGQLAREKSAAATADSSASSDEIGRMKRLGFSSVAECLLTIPKAYHDYTQALAIVGREHEESDRYVVLRTTADAGRYTGADGSPRHLQLFSGKFKTDNPRGANRLEISCRDARGTLVIVSVFGNIWPWREIPVGEVVHLHGFLTRFKDGPLTLKSPHPVLPASRGKVHALYAGKQGQVSGEVVAEAVSRAIHRLEAAEVLLLAQAGMRPAEFTELTGVKSVQTLLKLLHFPRDVAQGGRAMALARRLSAETVVRRAASARARPPVAGSAITVSKQLVEELISELPYPLTGDQRTAIDEIVTDLRSAYAMNRLLSGDVGTGKSITFMVPAVAAYAAGAEVAILVPSQLLVTQMANDLRTLFPGLPVCEVVADGKSGSKIGEGIVVGTTALLHAAKRAKRKFNMVITDEQHKFSVEQKAALTDRSTNVLEATATAIPRTLALVSFGGMDVSVLRECPVKKAITTRLVGEDDLSRVHKFVADVVATQSQVAVIYPLVDGAGQSAATEGLESVVSAGAEWELRHPGRVGVLHGKLSASEKANVIEGMHAGRFDVLVSSLVIEVGVTLPSLKAIVIKHPERFGLAQLHQLRGRVARKGGKGYMFMVGSASMEPDAMERLQILESCSDGFALAEADMDARGFGDVSDDSSVQTGTTRTLFHNARLTHVEIASTAKRLGVAT